MKRLKSINILLLKVLLPNIAMLTIPFIIVCVLVFSPLNNIFVDQRIQNDMMLLLSARDKFDAELRSMQSLFVDISNNKKLDPYYLSKGKYAQIEAVQTLSNYASANNFNYEILYYIKGQDVIYGSNSIYNMKTNDMSSIYNMFHLKQNQFLGDLENSSIVLRVYGNNMFFYISDMQPKSKRVGIFNIKTSSMQSRLFSYSPDVETIMLNEEYKLLLSSDTEKADQYIDAAVKSSESHSTRMKINGEEYVLTSTDSNIVPIRFYRFTKADLLLKDLKKVQRTISLILIAVMLISNAVVILYNRKYYFLLTNIKKHSRNDIKGIGDVNTAIVKLFNDKLTLEEQNSHFLTQMNREFARKLLTGSIKDRTSYVQESAGMKLTACYECFRLLLVKQSGSAGADIQDTINRIISELYTENRLLTYRLEQDLVSDFDVLVINYDAALCGTFMSFFNKTMEKCNLKYALSRAVNEISDIAKELSFLYDYIVGGADLTYEHILPEQYRPDILKSWNSSLVERNIEQAFFNVQPDYLREITNEFLNINPQGHSLVYINYIYYDYINALIRVLKKYAALTDDIKTYYNNIIHKIVFSDVQTLKENLNTFVDMICADKYFDKTDFDQIVKACIEYIQKNYSDSNLNVLNIASDLNYSYKYISRHFKAKTGYNLSDYIHKVRVEKFKDFVRNPGFNVKNLTKKTGYNNIESLNRHFKTQEGVSVEQYMSMIK